MRGPGRHGLRRFGRRRYLFEIGQKYRSAPRRCGALPNPPLQTDGRLGRPAGSRALAAERQYR